MLRACDKERRVTRRARDRKKLKRLGHLGLLHLGLLPPPARAGPLLFFLQSHLISNLLNVLHDQIPALKQPP
jgi:hypothetical protein